MRINRTITYRTTWFPLLILLSARISSKAVLVDIKVDTSRLGTSSSRGLHTPVLPIASSSSLFASHCQWLTNIALKEAKPCEPEC